jgi:hypothetical protein
VGSLGSVLIWRDGGGEGNVAYYAVGFFEKLVEVLEAEYGRFY